jgi:hypothetical protein
MVITPLGLRACVVHESLTLLAFRATHGAPHLWFRGGVWYCGNTAPGWYIGRGATREEAYLTWAQRQFAALEDG